MAHDLVTELLQYSSLACFMAIWQLFANLLIHNCLRSNHSCSPLAALELYVNIAQTKNITLYLVQFYVAAIHFSALIFISYNLLKNRPNLTMRIIVP